MEDYLSFCIHPSTKKVYRHPVLLPSGQLEELREAQKKGETEYIRFRELEDFIRNTPVLWKQLCLTDKSSTQRVVEYVFKARKRFANVRKHDSFSLIGLSDLVFMDSETKGESIWNRLSLTTKEDRDQVLLYLWEKMEIDLKTERGLRAMAAACSDGFGFPPDDSHIGKVMWIIRQKVGRDCQLVLDMKSDLIKHIEKPIEYLQTCALPFCPSIFAGAIDSTNKELLEYMFTISPFSFFCEGSSLLDRMVMTRNFEELFSLIPVSKRWMIVVSPGFLEKVVLYYDYWSTVKILTMVIDQCQVRKQELLACFVSEFSPSLVYYILPRKKDNLAGSTSFTRDEFNSLRKWIDSLPAEIFAK